MTLEAAPGAQVGRIYRVHIPTKTAPKGRPRFSKQTGRAYTPRATVVAEAWIRMCVTQAVGTPRVEGPVAVRAVFTSPVPSSWSRAKQSEAMAGRLHPTSRPDVENQLKTVFDALIGVAWKDDSQIVRVEAVKQFGAAPGTLIEWHEVAPEPGQGARQAPRALLDLL